MSISSSAPFRKALAPLAVSAFPTIPKFDIMRLDLPPLCFHRQPPAQCGGDGGCFYSQADAWREQARAFVGEFETSAWRAERSRASQIGTDTPQSAIVAVIMPDLEKGAAMWSALLSEGLYVNLARPPATPANMTLLRCSLCAEHTGEEVETILGMFERAGKAIGII